jgi:cytochrome b561
MTVRCEQVLFLSWIDLTMIKNSKEKYGSVSKFFHWSIFFLLIIMFTLGYVIGDISDKSLRGQVVNVHKLIGILVLALMVLRAIWALCNVKPALPKDTPAWQRWSERSLHFILYAGLFLMPMSGWVGSVAGGRPPHLGSIHFELPIAQSKIVSNFSFDYVHVPLAIILIVLISIHILAAFYHYFFKHDNILQRMLP